MSGVPKDYFEVEGAESTENRINSGIITARFAKTDAAVNSKNIKGVTAPATGEKPVTSITETEQYTGVWYGVQLLPRWKLRDQYESIPLR